MEPNEIKLHEIENVQMEFINISNIEVKDINLLG